MLRVEFIGLPGVGKSTIRRKLLNRLRRSDGHRYLSTEEAFLRVAKSHIDRIYRVPLNLLPNTIALNLSRRLQYRTRMHFDAQNRFLATRGEALGAFFASGVYEGMSSGDRKLVIGSFLETGSVWECLNVDLLDGVTVLFEEGFVQKSFMFVDRSIQSQPDTDQLYRYLRIIPLPDLVVYVRANPETCRQRMEARPDGLTVRLRSASKDEIERFFLASQQHLERVAAWLRDEHEDRLVELSNESSSPADLDEICTRISNLAS